MYADLYLQGRAEPLMIWSRGMIALRDVNDGYAALKDGSNQPCRGHFVLTANSRIRGEIT